MNYDELEKAKELLAQNKVSEAVKLLIEILHRHDESITQAENAAASR